MSHVVYLTIILHLPLNLGSKHVSSALTSHFANVRFVKRVNSQFITSYYIILPSSQSTANYKVPRTTSGSIVTIQRPKEICLVSLKQKHKNM